MVFQIIEFNSANTAAFPPEPSESAAHQKSCDYCSNDTCCHMRGGEGKESSEYRR